MTRRITLMLVTLLAATIAWAQEAPLLIKNGGFEDAAPNGQAVGWCAWGGDNAIPAFQRVTAGAHSGQACMQLLPTKQYLINGRDDNWVRPAAGVNYRLSFWLRSDLPHPMSFWIGQYKSLTPNFEWGGDLLRATLDVGKQWKQYSARVPGSSITAPVLYLAFQPTTPGDVDRLATNPAAASYLDDVALEALPADESELAGEGAEVVNGSTHVLAAPEASSEVDPQRTRPSNRKVLGIALHRVNGGKGVYSPLYLVGQKDPLPVVVGNLKPLRLASTRVYAVGDEPWPVEETLDRLRRFCDLVAIPPGNVVVELETQSAESILAPEVWARAVAHNKEKKLGFRWWEISNEPYAIAWTKEAYFKTPELYSAHVVACAKAIRAADPSAKVGLSIASTIPGWGSTIMQQAAGSYDFACPHYYSGSRGFGPKTYYESALATCWSTFDWTRRDEADLRAANGARPVPLQVTEWAGVGDTADGKGTDLNPAGTNIIGALHRAIRQVWYLREDLVDGAMQWQSHAPNSETAGFAFFFWRDPPGGRTLVWYLSDLLSQHVGDQILADKVQSPMLEMGFSRLPVVHSICTRDSKTRALHWVIVNAAQTDTISCTLTIKGSKRNAKGQMTTLSQGIEDSPVVTDVAAVEQAGEVVFVGGKGRVALPPHSVSFVEVK